MKKSKVFALLACAVLLVVGSVAMTTAYLTSKDSVANTFTVGNVQITLDEKDVDNDADDTDNVTIAGEARDKANAYHLIPGGTYVKDPTVRFPATNETSYVFVKVENGIKDIESTASGYKNIATQITDNGWTQGTGESGKVPTGVYYKKVDGGAASDLVVFSSFEIDGSVTGTILDGYKTKTIKVTAYAIQEAGFADANEAWVAGAWS